MLFDIKLSTDRALNCSSLQVNGRLAKSLKERKPKFSHLPSFGFETDAISTFTYNSAWKMIQYNSFVIDMQFGIFTQVQLELDKTVEAFDSLVIFIY